MTCTITNPDAVNAEWLTEALRQSGCLTQGHVIRVRVTSESSYTSTIARLTLTFSGNAPSTAPVRLLLKLSRSDSEQQVVGHKQRQSEVEFHNKVAVVIPSPPIVRCYQASFCKETGASHLLFDDVSETHSTGEPFLPPPMSKAERAMDAFAEFHAFWWDNSTLGSIEPLPSKISVAERVADARENFPRFVDASGNSLTGSHRRVYETALSSLPELWQRVISGKNLSLIDGDANFSNVLLPHNPDSDRALIIDWQLYGISFAAEDLSHLIPLFWDRTHRQMMERDLLKRYYHGLIRHGVKDYEWHDCWDDYRLAVLLRVLLMPMWFCLSGSPESWWQGCLERAMEAVEDLHCLELLETQ